MGRQCVAGGGKAYGKTWICQIHRKQQANICFDRRLPCLSQCFNLRHAVNEKDNGFIVVETPISTVDINIRL